MNVIHTDFAQGTVTVEDVSFDSGDHRLQGKLFRPSAEPKAIVILNGATGVPARFYRAFAMWLATEKNLACLTYDYRDFGASAQRSLRQSTATMADWGVHDQQAARDFAVSQVPKAPIWIIGHSLGALCLPFQKELDQISRVIAAGYMPGKKLGLGADLPAGVYWQWRRWCTRTDFFVREIGSQLPQPDWTGMKADMKFVAMADDVMMPPRSVWKLMEFYPAARKEQVVLRPKEFGLAKLGHIEAFAEKNSAVWDAILA